MSSKIKGEKSDGCILLASPKPTYELNRILDLKPADFFSQFKSMASPTSESESSSMSAMACNSL